MSNSLENSLLSLKKQKTNEIYNQSNMNKNNIYYMENIKNGDEVNTIVKHTNNNNKINFTQSKQQIDSQELFHSPDIKRFKSEDFSLKK